MFPDSKPEKQRTIAEQKLATISGIGGLPGK
jgi:hypothetical protein